MLPNLMASFSFTVDAFLLLLLVVLCNGDHVKFCINDVTQDVSNMLRSTKSMPAGLIDLNYTQEYSVPPSKAPSVVVPINSSLVPSKFSILQGASLHRVRIDPLSREGQAQQTNLEYLLDLDVDYLVYSFRRNAGINAPGSPYGGWEAPDKELRGHFVGHYLSASAMMWASTHNSQLKSNMDKVVDSLFQCQRRIGTGYLSAFPDNFFTRWETYHPVWAPYYTMHKIMAGLLDQYKFAGNENALTMVTWMVQYFSDRVDAYIKKYTVEAHHQALNEEVGGMNDILYELYKFSGNPEHLRLAHLFDKPCFLGPLAIEADTLAEMHANTHLPILVGAQNRYEVSDDKIYEDLSKFFFKVVTTSHSYATGGTSSEEFWVEPNRMGDTLSMKDVQESCSTYNMLKVARNLFRFTKDISYADYYEHALLNGVLTIQRGTDSGVMIYMLGQGHGMSKATSTLGWGNKNNSMWCCYGTGIESFSKLGDSIYFEDHGVRDNNPGAQVPIPALYVIQFVSSTLFWDATGLLLNQIVVQITSDKPVLQVKIELTKGNVREMSNNPIVTTQVVDMNVRIPSWTSNPKAYLNAEEQIIVPGEFLHVERIWQEGDQILLEFPAIPIFKLVDDDRQEFSSLNAILYGPYLLAGLSHGDYHLGPVNATSYKDWLIPVKSTQNAALYTFSIGTNQLGHKSSFITLDHSTISGTDWDYQATFKVASTSTNLTTLAGEIVTLEIMDEPGRFVAHAGINKDLVVITGASFGDNGGNPVSSQFKVISNGDNMVLFESVNTPGCYIFASGWRSKAQLRCIDPDNIHNFMNATTFQVTKALASYHPLSFIARGNMRNYLLFPHMDYKDEHYNIYFHTGNMR